ncbi:MAG: hypothetical protein WEC75_06465 [Dehalococcoidia bacterium]
MTTLYEQLQSRLDQGFYGDNLDRITALAEDTYAQTQNPAALFAFARILRLIQTEWPTDIDGDQASVPLDVVASMERQIKPALDAFLADSGRRTLTAEEQLAHMNAMISAYIRWRFADR